MEDQLLQWFDVKQRLRETPREPPLVSEGDIWWASIGENVGSEIHGKSRAFSRPVVIYRKLGRSFFMVAPTTTTPKNGTWYIPIHSLGTDMRVCLHQMRTMDYRRLSTKMGCVTESEANQIRDGFLNLYS